MRIALTLILLGHCVCMHAQEKKVDAGTATTFAAVHAQDMVIDGKLDEASWKQATPAIGDYLNGKTGLVSKAPRATVRYAWDDDYFFAALPTAPTDAQDDGKGDRYGASAVAAPESPAAERAPAPPASAEC